MQSKRYLIFLLITYPLFLYGKDLPNILWIYAEDTSPWMGCYGDPINADATPHIDSIAAAGVQFTRAYVPAPVCSATRSAMMLGQNAKHLLLCQHVGGACKRRSYASYKMINARIVATL